MKHKMSTSIREIDQKILNSIVNESSAGLGQEPFHCLTTESPKKEVKKLQKNLKSTENWQIHRGTAWISYGIPFNGLASWGWAVSVRLGGHEFRYRLFRLDRFGERKVYAIPIGMLSSFTELPNVSLSSSEIALLKQMADDLMQKREMPEKIISIEHPAKSTLKANRDLWENENLDSSALHKLLEENPALRDITVAATAAHYRSFLDSASVPDGVFNFVLPAKNKDTDLWFVSVLQSLTFTNDSGMTTAGPITISLKEAADLQRWRRCNERLAVIRTSTGALLWPLLEDLEERERILKGGGTVSTALPTVPISLTNGLLHHPQATDILLPVEPPLLTYEQRDMLRSAMSRLIRKKYAEVVNHAPLRFIS